MRLSGLQHCLLRQADEAQGSGQDPELLLRVEQNPRDRRAARIADANLNRLTEGLRVVEEVLRLGSEDRRLLTAVRALRARIGRETRAFRRSVIPARQSEEDPGRPEKFDRARRRNLDDVLAANFKRAEEAARVLEEVLKVLEPKLSGRMKETRFRLYDLEKRALARPGPAA